jgi:hypothetical protein
MGQTIIIAFFFPFSLACRLHTEYCQLCRHTMPSTLCYFSHSSEIQNLVSDIRYSASSICYLVSNICRYFSLSPLNFFLLQFIIHHSTFDIPPLPQTSPSAPSLPAAPRSPAAHFLIQNQTQSFTDKYPSHQIPTLHKLSFLVIPAICSAFLVFKKCNSPCTPKWFDG